LRRWRRLWAGVCQQRPLRVARTLCARRSGARYAAGGEHLSERYNHTAGDPDTGGEEMIRVLICDDKDVVREGLRAILSTSADFEVVGMASDGAQAMELVDREQPDVVLMDLNMPGMNGI